MYKVKTFKARGVYRFSVNGVMNPEKYSGRKAVKRGALRHLDAWSGSIAGTKHRTAKGKAVTFE